MRWPSAEELPSYLQNPPPPTGWVCKRVCPTCSVLNRTGGSSMRHGGKSPSLYKQRNQLQKLLLPALRPVSCIELYARGQERSNTERKVLINAVTGEVRSDRPVLRYKGEP